MATLFISHSSEDFETVASLGKQLRAWGYNSLFLDFDPEDGIVVGRKWERELYLQLRAADAVVFVASGASVASRWCFAELAMARSSNKEIFPVAIEAGATLPLLRDAQWLDLTNGSGVDALRRALHERFDRADVFGWDRERSPYPGLRPFEVEDAAVFFGRDDVVSELVGRLEGALAAAPVAVIGASGSGKSSLVRAGVLPRLRRRPERWVVVPPLTPGDLPIGALARALAIPLRADRAEVEARLAGGLAELVRDLATGADGRLRSVLLFVDQAEELVTLAGPDERNRFLALLRTAAAAGAPLRTLVTLRSEYLGASLGEVGLAELVQGQPVLIGPLERSRLAQVILRPAQKVALEFEEGLVERMVDETRGGDALPLLAHTLRELYDRERVDPYVVSVGDYEAIGGVEGALRRTADRAAAELHGTGRAPLMLPTLVRLATVDADGAAARRRLPLTALDGDERAVVQPFVDAHLLVTSRSGEEAVVEVAHEALLRVWPPLVRAIDAARERLQLQAELARDAAAWDYQRRAHSYLLRGERLARARRILEPALDDLSPLEREFLAASLDLERRERAAVTRRRRLIVTGATVAFVLITTAALVSFSLYRTTRDREQEISIERDKAESTALASQALARLDENPSDGLALAYRAMSFGASTALAEATLRLAVSRTPPQTILRRQDDWAERVVFHPDGRRVASSAPYGTVRVWDRTAPRKPVAVWPDIVADGLRFAAGGDRLVAVDNDGSVSVLDLASRRVSETRDSPFRDEGVSAVALSDDARAVAVAGEGGVQVWRWASPGARPTVLDDGRFDDVWALAFSPAGDRVAVGEREGVVRVWDVRRPRRAPTVLGGRDELDALAFAPDGQRLAIAHHAIVRIWDTQAPRAHPVELRGHRNTVWELKFSPDGARVASAGWDQTVRVWDWHHPRAAPTVLHGHADQVRTLDFSPNGRSLVSAGGDGTVRIWDWQTPTPPPVELGASNRRSREALAFSPDGRELAAAAHDSGSVELWNWREPGTPPRMPKASRDAGVSQLAYSADGRWLAGAGGGPVLVWDRRKPGSPKTLGDGQLAFHSSALSRDGRIVAGAAGDGTLRVWDLEAPATAPVALGEAARERVPGVLPAPDVESDVTFSPDGVHLASFRDDVPSAVFVYDRRRPRAKPRSIEGQNTTVQAVAFSPHGRYLATSGADQQTRVFDMRDLGAGPIVLLRDHHGVTFSPDGRFLVGVNVDGAITVTDWRDSRIPRTVVPSATRLLGFAFAPDNRHFAAAGSDGVIRIYDCQRCGAIGYIRARARERLPRG